MNHSRHAILYDRPLYAYGNYISEIQFAINVGCGITTRISPPIISSGGTWYPSGEPYNCYAKRLMTGKFVGEIVRVFIDGQWLAAGVVRIKCVDNFSALDDDEEK